MALREGRNESGAIGGGPQAASRQDQDNETSVASKSGQATPTSAKDTSDDKGGQVAVSSQAQVTTATTTAEAPPPKKKGKAKRVFTLVLLAGLGFGGYEAYHWWTEGRFIASTDDAYVTADITVILSK
ncbi:MAG: HlyD family secretion protein, partial [Roseibium sp.]|nr:HlyD family secretion protein [Roseibium sp.]